jgi:hypothetical protein
MRFIPMLMATVIALATTDALAHSMDLGPEARVDDVARSLATQDRVLDIPMCNKGDEVVFSCPLGDGSKTASMCVGGDVATGKGRFYYAFGKPGADELLYPRGDRMPDDAFTRTRLALAGNRGGYAYAFVNNGYKYVVYAVSGDRSQQDAGVIIQRTGERNVVAKLQCQAGKITETDDDAVIEATLKWKPDSLIEADGLPAMR